MHLAPTVEQQALKDAVRRFCAEQVTAERLMAWEKLPRAVDDGCWQTIADLGWFGLGIPAAQSGSGLSLVDVACVLEECGRGLIPRPVINAIHGAMALTLIDPTSPDLQAIGRGEALLALALDEKSARTPVHFTTRAQRDGSVTSVSGEKWYVPDAEASALHLVAACDATGVSLALVEAAKAVCRPLRTFDGDRQAVVRYDRAPVRKLLASGTAGTQLLAALRRQQLALSLAEMVGGMDALLAMTVDYVKQREQFGQKIAVFQAVQHQVADMAMASTASRHLAWQAITRMAGASEHGAELVMAASFIGQAFKRVSLTALHLHGGAGYVVEHLLHYHAERAQSLCVRYTPEAAMLHDVACGLLD